MLCIDKFRSTGKQMSFIAVDAKTHDIITILPGRKNADIKDFFSIIILNVIVTA